MRHFIVLLLAAFLVCSCGYREGIIQGADKSYLQFIGNIENVSVHIDDMEPFSVNTAENKHYQIYPGKHAIKIYRNGSLIVNKVIFVQNQTTMEVQVP